MQPEDENCLAYLAYLYFEEGDFSHSRAAVEMCLEVAPDGEARDGILKFAREHVAELNLPAGIV
jgi:cytochrome c-type biogenesis protein CcmH/NrfG